VLTKEFFAIYIQPESMVPLQGAPLSNIANPAPEKASPHLPPPAYQVGFEGSNL
jgi:hypothetical protein